MNKNIFSIILSVAVVLSLLMFGYYVVFNRPDPTQTFIVSYLPEEPLEGQETVFSFDSKAPANNFFWSIEDSIYRSENPTHIFSEPGTYSVRLNLNGMEQEVLVNIAERQLEVLFIPSDTTININRKIQLEDLTDPSFVKSRAWYINENIVSKEKSYTREFNSPGDFTVKLVINDKFSSETNISVTEPVEVSSEDIQTYKPEASVSINATEERVDLGQSISFSYKSDKNIEEPTWSCNACTERFIKGKSAKFTFTKPGWTKVYLNYTLDKPGAKFKRIYVKGKEPKIVSGGKETLTSEIEVGLNQLLNSALSMQDRKGIIKNLKHKLGDQNVNVSIPNENRQESFHSYTMNLLIDPDQNFSKIRIAKEQTKYQNNKITEITIRHVN